MIRTVSEKKRGGGGANSYMKSQTKRHLYYNVALW